MEAVKEKYKFPAFKEYVDNKYKLSVKLDFLLESANKLPGEFILNKMVSAIDSSKFTDFKGDMISINESLKDVPNDPIFPTFYNFSNGMYDVNVKIKFITESIKHIPKEVVFHKLINEISDSAFENLKKDIYEAVDIIYEKKREGKGGLKALVDKEQSDELSISDSTQIGKKVANMTGKDKKKYIGIINYLGATCVIFHIIRNTYMSEIKKAAKGNVPEEFKPERPTGHNDTLKFLVGKEGEETIEIGDAKRIGRLISRMGTFDRRDYVGMVNFLGASCRIHHEMIAAYQEEIKVVTGKSMGRRMKGRKRIPSGSGFTKSTLYGTAKRLTADKKAREERAARTIARKAKRKPALIQKQNSV